MLYIPHFNSQSTRVVGFFRAYVDFMNTKSDTFAAWTKILLLMLNINMQGRFLYTK